METSPFKQDDEIIIIPGLRSKVTFKETNQTQSLKTIDMTAPYTDEDDQLDCEQPSQSNGDQTQNTVKQNISTDILHITQEEPDKLSFRQPY